MNTPAPNERTDRFLKEIMDLYQRQSKKIQTYIQMCTHALQRSDQNTKYLFNEHFDSGSYEGVIASVMLEFYAMEGTIRQLIDQLFTPNLQTSKEWEYMRPVSPPKPKLTSIDKYRKSIIPIVSIFAGDTGTECMNCRLSHFKSKVMFLSVDSKVGTQIFFLQIEAKQLKPVSKLSVSQRSLGALSHGRYLLNYSLRADTKEIEVEECLQKERLVYCMRNIKIMEKYMDSVQVKHLAKEKSQTLVAVVVGNQVHYQFLLENKGVFESRDRAFTHTYEPSKGGLSPQDIRISQLFLSCRNEVYMGLVTFTNGLCQLHLLPHNLSPTELEATEKPIATVPAFEDITLLAAVYLASVGVIVRIGAYDTKGSLSKEGLYIDAHQLVSKEGEKDSYQFEKRGDQKLYQPEFEEGDEVVVVQTGPGESHLRNVVRFMTSRSGLLIAADIEGVLDKKSFHEQIAIERCAEAGYEASSALMLKDSLYIGYKTGQFLAVYSPSKAGT